MTALPPLPPAPHVSVLMTTYNGARFVAESIDSVLAQTFSDFELVVVDDASTDETASILAGYADPRLRVIRNAANLGVVGARNRGFAELHGPYVATLDHDDVWLPTRLAAGVAQLDSHPATVLVATQTLTKADGQFVRAERPAAANSLLFRWMLLFDCPVVYSSLLFRREVARRADGTFLRPELRYADDYELMLRLVSAGDGSVLSEALTIYRVHGGNTTWQVLGEMYRNAVTVQTEHLTPYFGDEAEEAARLIAWHIARRYPVPDRTTLRRLGTLLRRLTETFIAAHRPESEDRARIERYVRQTYWRTLRASIRSGRIWLFGADRGGPTPSVHALGTLGDVAESLAVGMLRLPARVFLSAHGKSLPKT